MMVRLALENGVGTVELFGRADSDELVWESKLAQRPRGVGPCTQGGVKSVRSANEESGVTQSAVHQSLEVL